MSRDLELCAQQWNPLAFYPTQLLITNHVGRIVPRKLWTSAGPHLLRVVGSLPVKVTENCAMTSATRAVTTAFLKSHSTLGWRGNRTAVWLYSKCSWKFGGWIGWAEGEQQGLSRKAGCEAVWAQHLPSLVGLLPSIYEGRALDANINSSSAFPLQPLKNSNKSHCISYVSITVAVHPSGATWRWKILFWLITEILSVRHGKTEDVMVAGSHGKALAITANQKWSIKPQLELCRTIKGPDLSTYLHQLCTAS